MSFVSACDNRKIDINDFFVIDRSNFRMLGFSLHLLNFIRCNFYIKDSPGPDGSGRSYSPSSSFDIE